MKLKNIRAIQRQSKKTSSTRTCRDRILVTTRRSKTTSIWTEFALVTVYSLRVQSEWPSAMCWCFRLVHQSAVWMGDLQTGRSRWRAQRSHLKRTHHVHELEIRSDQFVETSVISHKCEENQDVRVHIRVEKSDDGPRVTIRLVNDAEHHKSNWLEICNSTMLQAKLSVTSDSNLFDVRKRIRLLRTQWTFSTQILLFMRQVTTLELIGISVKTRLGQKPSLPMKFHLFAAMRNYKMSFQKLDDLVIAISYMMPFTDSVLNSSAAIINGFKKKRAFSTMTISGWIWGLVRTKQEQCEQLHRQNKWRNRVSISEWCCKRSVHSR